MIQVPNFKKSIFRDAKPSLFDKYKYYKITIEIYSPLNHTVTQLESWNMNNLWLYIRSNISHKFTYTYIIYNLWF